MDNASYDPLTALLASSLSSGGLSPLVNAEQAATMLGCSKEHVEGLADRGQLPATKYGRGWIFVAAQLIQRVARDCEANVRAPDMTSQSAKRPKSRRSGHDRSKGEPEAEGTSLPLEPRGPAKGRGRPRMSVPDFKPAA